MKFNQTTLQRCFVCTLAGATAVAVDALLDTILRVFEKVSTRLGRSLTGMQCFNNFGDNEQNAMLIPTSARNLQSPMAMMHRETNRFGLFNLHQSINLHLLSVGLIREVNKH